ncbi:MAG TPA: ABC transporter ATP-binding protein [Thermoanaerobaculia bacterium]|nr:ABC transporter ATP-binding protein [Thermoanaerobaculia bacterium]
MTRQPIISLTNITREYRLGNVPVRALENVTLEIAHGDFLALAGPSGSGKTTLLNLIGCIDKPDSGRILFDGVDVTGIPLHRLSRLRLQSLGFVFQTFNLIPVLTAFENVEYPLLMQGVPKRRRESKVRHWLDQVGINQQSGQRPDEMSGGQRQRVGIARAMVGDPRLVVADEPTANLDSENASRILDLLARLNETTRATFVLSTHDPAVMARARRVIRLRDGRVAGEESNPMVIDTEEVAC